MNAIILLFLFFLLARARTRRDKLKVAMVITTVLSYHQEHANIANLRRMVSRLRTTSLDDTFVVHLLAALGEELTGVNDQHNSEIIRRIMKGNKNQFRRMFWLSRCVFEAVLGELPPYPRDSNSCNSQQYAPFRMKLGLTVWLLLFVIRLTVGMLFT